MKEQDKWEELKNIKQKKKKEKPREDGIKNIIGRIKKGSIKRQKIDIGKRKEKNKIAYIYILLDPRNDQVRYVGKTITPKKRFTRHKNEKKLHHRGCWIRQLRREKLIPIMEIIDITPETEWKFWESHYISLYKSWGFKLTNETNGGEGGATFRGNVSKKVIQKDFNGNIIKIYNSISEAQKQTGLYLECILNKKNENIKNGFIWEKLPKQIIRKIIKPKYTKQDKSYMFVPILQKTINDIPIKTYESIKKASDETKINIMNLIVNLTIKI